MRIQPIQNTISFGLSSIATQYTYKAQPEEIKPKSKPEENNGVKTDLERQPTKDEFVKNETKEDINPQEEYKKQQAEKIKQFKELIHKPQKYSK